MPLLMSNMAHQHPTAYSSHEKTYVWVKLRSDGTSCIISPTQGGSSSTKNSHRRQRTTSASASVNDDLDDLWKWTPGYYSCTSQPATAADLSSSAPSSAATLVEYHFTLMEQRTADLNYEQHTIPENIASKYLESGDIVLANSWEIHDFMHRFENEDYDGNDNNMDVADRNPSQPPHNLIELTHLHEPSVVNALRHRYYQRTREQRHDIHNVYTDTGSILLAVNPFQIAEDDDEEEEGSKVGRRSISSNRLSLYGENTMHQYKLDGEKRWIHEMLRMEHGRDDSDDTNNSSSSSSTLPPHVYAVADRTFRTMMTRMHHKGTSSASAVVNNRANSAAASAGKRRESVDVDNEKVNQSILVSGESGAGKTVTTKLLMTYLSKLSKGGAVASSDGDDSLSSASSSFASPNDFGMSIEKRILESNPILESFGNARTVRNDNSSRFGKYIEMKFESAMSSLPSSSSSSDIIIPDASLVGASIETYLLEKVRLVHQSPGERNYHIFYELFSMKYAEEDDDNGIVRDENNEGGVVSFQELGLLDYDMEDFRMLNNSGTYDRRDGVSDQQTFWNTKHAMKTMEFTPCDVSNVLHIIASLLHASNLTFVQKGVSAGQNECDECALDETNPHLEYVVNLLGISVDKLNSAVCYHEITIGGDGGGANGFGRVHHNRGGTSETHQRVLTQEQAAKGVEALIKATYGAIFEYLVRRINSSVASGNASRPNQLAAERSRAGMGRLVKESSIGILDIFGFESFQTNSFEQLCINYCNEALQQQFNRFVLKREQEEYDREGIPWSFIEFPENQDVLDLLDSKGLGIFNLLHDQCRMPRASDKSFAHSMYEKCSNHIRFEADSRQKAEQMFAVHHYAGVVEYDVEGFVEKNRDELPKTGLNLMLSSTNGFVRTLAHILAPSSTIISSTLSPPSKGKQIGGTQRPTVGVQFSSQLHDLRRKIDDTSPHYIRCLKPNSLFTPDHFDEALVSNQLRCAGVIEAVQVSRLGYPHRFSHRQFFARYHMLGGKSINLNKKNSAVKSLVESIKERDHQLEAGVQVGKTKVFLHNRAHELLEKLRRERVVSAAIIVQKTIRRYLCQNVLASALIALVKMQSFIRKGLAVIVVANMRRERNSIVIQTSWRKYRARTIYLSSVAVTNWCQSRFRGSVGRQVYHRMKCDKMSLYIQTRWRGRITLKRYQRQRNAAVLIQCAWKCHAARSELGARKAESRNLSMVMQERDRLREESKALRNELNMIRRANEANSLKSAAEIADANVSEVHSLRVALAQLRSEKEIAETKLEQANRRILALQSERVVAFRDSEESKQAQSELNSAVDWGFNTVDDADIAALDQLRKAKVPAMNQLEEQANDEISAQMNGSGAGVRGLNLLDTDGTEVLFLRNALDQLAKEKRLAENRLEDATTEILDLKSERDAIIRDRDDLKQVNKVIQSELIACEEELRHLKENLDRVKKQNIALGSSKTIGTDSTRTHADLLRAHSVAGDIPDHSVEDSTVPESEDESRISRLDDFNVDMERSRTLAMYELDDMKRVNRSLREDLEALTAEKHALTKQLEEKWDEFNELNDDVDKFAEAFAAQESELEKLQFENKMLKASAQRDNLIH